jgi:hypothetical protein
MNKHDDDDDDLDTLLGGDLLQPPDDFARRVMQRVHRLPLPARHAGLLAKLQNLALCAGAVAGAAQLAAFMFGIWAAASAG